MTKYLIIALLLISTLASAQSIEATLQQYQPLVADKMLHVDAGFGISFGVGLATKRPWIGFVSGVAAGVSKEVWDNYHENEPFKWHVADVAITAAGSACAWWVVRQVRKAK
jgi:hypothetical protein